MTDTYDLMRKDWCDAGDMPRATCHHCGAHPGGPALPLDDGRPWTFDGQHVTRRSGRNVFPTIADPLTEDRPKVKRGHGSAGLCACGTPTRDDAYGCDHCAGELERILGDAPWLAEQLDATITRQRAAAAAGGTNPDSLPWNDKASHILARLRKLLATTVRLCVRYDVRHQSPYDGGPDGDSIRALSAWLLWRVDGLTLRPEFTKILKVGLRVEADALLAIDRGPDLMYLGLCDHRDEDGLCGGAVYARTGDELGKCRACRAEYDVAKRRGGLERALDDRLCTASEIAHLATYLGLPASRDRVRNLVNQWHRRGRITAAGGKGEARFRYGDIAVLLAAAYPDEKGA